MRAVSSGMALQIIPDVSDCMITSYLVFRNVGRKRSYKCETIPKSWVRGVLWLQVYVWTGWEGGGRSTNGGWTVKTALTSASPSHRQPRSHVSRSWETLPLSNSRSRFSLFICLSFPAPSDEDCFPPVGRGAGEDLRHARPHHAWRGHQGSDHVVRFGWPRAGGHHRLGETYPR